MRTLLVKKILRLKTLRFNFFLATFLTAISLFVALMVYSLLLKLNLVTGLIFFVILLPIVANLSSTFFSSPKNLGVAISGMLLFYAFMIFMTYKTDVSILIAYSVLPTFFLVFLYNYRHIPFFIRKWTIWKPSFLASVLIKQCSGWRIDPLSLWRTSRPNLFGQKIERLDMSLLTETWTFSIVYLSPFPETFFDKSIVRKYIWGRPVLTGCVMTYASMQAHGMRALKDSPITYLASLTTPWLLNLT